MIENCKGDIFESDCQALVNPVNCVGVMGGGLAYVFKRKYPMTNRLYEMACKEGRLTTGKVFTVREKDVFIICFPTKFDWQKPSEMDFITGGLLALLEEIKKLGIQSVAIPALGCGLGGLEWAPVKSAIENAFYGTNIRVELYEPKEIS